MNEKEIKQITDYIFLSSKPRPADLALIFGTKDPMPISVGADLYQRGLIPKILLSGGVNKSTKEVEALKMAEGLKALGVKESDLIIEDQSKNSLENVLFSLKKIDQEIGLSKINIIIAIVKHYHSRRALMTLKKHFPKHIQFIPVTYEIYGFTKDNWQEAEIGREKVLSEWQKIPKYLAQGDLAELDDKDLAG